MKGNFLTTGIVLGAIATISFPINAQSVVDNPLLLAQSERNSSQPSSNNNSQDCKEEPSAPGSGGKPTKICRNPKSKNIRIDWCGGIRSICNDTKSSAQTFCKLQGNEYTELLNHGVTPKPISQTISIIDGKTCQGRCYPFVWIRCVNPNFVANNKPNSQPDLNAVTQNRQSSRSSSSSSSAGKPRSRDKSTSQSSSSTRDNSQNTNSSGSGSSNERNSGSECDLLNQQLTLVNLRIKKLKKNIKEIETYLANAKADRDKIKEENSDFQSKVKEARENLQAVGKSPIEIPEKPILSEVQRKIIESKTKARVAKYLSFSKSVSSVVNKSISIGLRVTTKLPSASLLSLKIMLSPTPLYDGFDLKGYEETIKTLEPRIDQNKEKIKELEQNIQKKRYEELPELSIQLHASTREQRSLKIQMQEKCRSRKCKNVGERLVCL